MRSIVVWYLATCQDCTPILPQPFSTEVERNEWAAEHAGVTGHEVRYHETARPAPAGGTDAR